MTFVQFSVMQLPDSVPGVYVHNSLHTSPTVQQEDFCAWWHIGVCF